MKILDQSVCNSMLLFAIAVPGGHKQQNKAAAGLITAAGAYRLGELMLLRLSSCSLKDQPYLECGC